MNPLAASRAFAPTMLLLLAMVACEAPDEPSPDTPTEDVEAEGSEDPGQDVGTAEPPEGDEGSLGPDEDAAPPASAERDEVDGDADDDGGNQDPLAEAGPESQEAEPEPIEPPSFVRPDSIRGIYLTAWSAGSAARSEALLELTDETELNTFVVDLKDATGYISHRTDVEMALELGADGERRIGDLQGLLKRMEAAGVYPIARIVVFKDHLLPETRPDLALRLKDAGEGEFWRDNGGHPWTSPRSREVWDYHIELAREAAELGFPEIQWDYVRFPDIPSSVQETLHMPGDEEGTRAEVIRRFLDYSRSELADLDVRVTADVFGVAATAPTDVGIGQRWEDFIDVVDVALPMIYPSHYWQGSFGFQEPNAHPYEVVWESLGQAQSRSEGIEGAGEIIPWLQDFTMGSPRYEAPEVRAQIQATYDRDIPHWILWNPASRYTREALAPVDGFPEGHDPLVRIGGRVIPTSERMETLLGPEEAPVGSPDATEDADDVSDRELLRPF